METKLPVKENPSEKVILAPLALTLAVDAFSDLIAIVDEFLDKKHKDTGDLSVTSIATIGYFENLSLGNLVALRDKLASALTNSQYFVEAFSRILDAVIRKKLSE